MSQQIWNGYYQGDEFPDYFGFPIEYMLVIKECYMIRFIGKSEWYRNMHPEDISSTPIILHSIVNAKENETSI